MHFFLQRETLVIVQFRLDIFFSWGYWLRGTIWRVCTTGAFTSPLWAFGLEPLLSLVFAVAGCFFVFRYCLLFWSQLFCCDLLLLVILLWFVFVGYFVLFCFCWVFLVRFVLFFSFLFVRLVVFFFYLLFCCLFCFVLFVNLLFVASCFPP